MTGLEASPSVQYVDLMLQTYRQYSGGAPETLARFRSAAELFERVDWDESARLARRHRTEIKRCFDNCRRIALRNPDLTYCEGFATAIIPVAHAWLVRPDGVVIDPTFCLIETPSKVVDYFGIRILVKTLLNPSSNEWEPLWATQLEREAK